VLADPKPEAEGEERSDEEFSRISFEKFVLTKGEFWLTIYI